MATPYFRRTAADSRIRGGGKRYEVWQADGEPQQLSATQLDRLLDAGRLPADYWAAVESADVAYDQGDALSWIEFGTGRRVADPAEDG